MSDLQIIKGDARALPIPDNSVQCIVTSPPYWGLRKYSGEQELIWLPWPIGCEIRLPAGQRISEMCEHRFLEFSMMESDRDRIQHSCRCGAWRGAFGLEPTIEMYVQHTVEILRECRRVLRSDGVLFWNIGDSYSALKGYSGDLKPQDLQASNKGSLRGKENRRIGPQPCLKPKDLCLIPSRVALAAQADGWWVRSMILWAKPNPMPESVTDRPTDAYEHIIMLTKLEHYFWDADAVREPTTGNAHHPGYGDGGPKAREREKEGTFQSWRESTPERFSSRNLRNVWTFATQPYAEAHFATFPEELPRRCILAATSARGACLQCGAPWERVTRNSVTSGKSWNGDTLKSAGVNRNENNDFAGDKFYENYSVRQPIGWRPTCLCPGQRGKTAPCVILDPFAGSGTVGRVALELNRKAILNDLAYQDLQEARTCNVQHQLF